MIITYWVHVVDTNDDASMDEIYVTSFDDEHVDNHDYDDNTDVDHDNNYDIYDDLSMIYRWYSYIIAMLYGVLGVF